MAIQSTVIERGTSAKKAGGQSVRPGGETQQARTRVELGKEMLEAAQAYSVRQAAAVEALRAEQGVLREQVEREVTQSLRSYDQSMGELERRLVARVEAAERSMEQSVKALQTQWREAHGVMSEMVRRAEALLDQSRVMLEGAKESGEAMGRRAAGRQAAKRPTTPPTTPPATSSIARVKTAATPDPKSGEANPAEHASGENLSIKAKDSQGQGERRATKSVALVEEGDGVEDGLNDGPAPLIYTKAVELLRGGRKQEV